MVLSALKLHYNKLLFSVISVTAHVTVPVSVLKCNTDISKFNENNCDSIIKKISA